MTKISIIIRTLNEETHLSECLNSIQNQLINYEVEIIVVDSGSCDRTLEIASRFGVKIIEIEKQAFSFGGALNTGIEFSQGDVMVILSAHCVPRGRYWLYFLTRSIFAGKSDLAFGAQFADPGSRTSEYLTFHRSNSISNRPIQDKFHNGNSAFKKKVWELNKFNENVKAQEDVFFARNSINAGMKIIYEKNARLTHFHNYTNRQLYIRLYRDNLFNAKNNIKNNSVLDILSILILDLKYALYKRKLFRAIPGIVSYRLIELSVLLVIWIKNDSKVHTPDLEK